jgi:hypothetical protein
MGRGKNNGRLARSDSSPEPPLAGGKEKKAEKSKPDYRFERVRKSDQQGSQLGRLNAYKVEAKRGSTLAGKIARYMPKVALLEVTDQDEQQFRAHPPTDENPHAVSALARTAITVSCLRDIVNSIQDADSQESYAARSAMMHDALHKRFSSLHRQFIGTQGYNDKLPDKGLFPRTGKPGFGMILIPKYAALTEKDLVSNVSPACTQPTTRKAKYGLVVDNYMFGKDAFGEDRLISPISIAQVMLEHEHWFMYVAVHAHIGAAGSLYGEGVWLADRKTGWVQPRAHNRGSAYKPHPAIPAELLVDGSTDYGGWQFVWSAESDTCYGYVKLKFRRMKLGEFTNERSLPAEPPLPKFQYTKLELLNSTNPVLRWIDSTSARLPPFLSKEIRSRLPQKAEYYLVDRSLAKDIVSAQAMKTQAPHTCEATIAEIKRRTARDSEWEALERLEVYPKALLGTALYAMQEAANLAPTLTAAANSFTSGFFERNKALRMLGSPENPDYQLTYILAVLITSGSMFSLILAYKYWVMISLALTLLRWSVALAVAIYGGPHLIHFVRNTDTWKEFAAGAEASGILAAISAQLETLWGQNAAAEEDGDMALALFPAIPLWASAVWEECWKWCFPYAAVLLGVIEGARRRQSPTHWAGRVAVHFFFYLITITASLLLAILFHWLWNKAANYRLPQVTRDAHWRQVDAGVELQAHAPTMTPQPPSVHLKTGSVGTASFLEEPKEKLRS